MATTIALILLLFSAQTASAPGPAVTEKSPWVVTIVSSEAIKPGTPNEPQANPGEFILKITVKFQYTGPEGDVPAPVLKVTDGADKEYIMLGNLKVERILNANCMMWLMSASHVRLGEKPSTLASKTVVGCQDAVTFYFAIRENAKRPLALVFADAKPIPLSLK